VSVRGDELSGCPTIEVGDDSCEVFRQPQVIEGVDQLLVVGGGKCPLEVEIAKKYIFAMGVSVLDA
jgi:hypothetical protein